jgi:hypothetical protein
MTAEADNDRAEPIVREGEYKPPQYQAKAFHCALCGVYATHDWNQLRYGQMYLGPWTEQCGNCGERTFWVRLRDNSGGMRMADPVVGGGPKPHVDMPADVRRDYEEARGIVMQSPRGAGALLRLAAQKLVNELVSGSSDLNAKTAALVADGLTDVVAKALDVLRVVGNNAVHPGEMVLDDDPETVSALFELVNVVIEDRIARPARVSDLFGKLPAGARAAIEKRDAPQALPAGDEPPAPH